MVSLYSPRRPVRTGIAGYLRDTLYGGRYIHLRDASTPWAPAYLTLGAYEGESASFLFLPFLTWLPTGRRDAGVSPVPLAPPEASASRECFTDSRETRCAETVCMHRTAMVYWKSDLSRKAFAAEFASDTRRCRLPGKPPSREKAFAIITAPLCISTSIADDARY